MQPLNINPIARDPQAQRVNFAPGSSTPSFGPSQRLESPSFWTNLKDFLTERSVRVPRGARQEVFYTEGVDTSFSESLKSFFRPAPRIKGAPASNMTGVGAYVPTFLAQPARSDFAAEAAAP
jgi:hypothetical protein